MKYSESIGRLFEDWYETHCFGAYWRTVKQTIGRHIGELTRSLECVAEA